MEKQEIHCHANTVRKNEKITVAKKKKKKKKKFRQVNSLGFSLVKTLLSRNFCQRSVTVNSHNFHTSQWPSNFFSSNQLADGVFGS